MAEHKIYANKDATPYTSSSSSLENQAALTVAWEDMTAKGIANGDQIFLFVRYTLGNDTAQINSTIEISKGSTWAGRTPLRTAIHEPRFANAAQEGSWWNIITVNTDDDIYISLATETASTTNTTLDDFDIIIIQLDDLAADDWRFAEESALVSDLRPSSGVIDCASTTLPAASGDKWLAIGRMDFEVDNSFSDSMISAGLSLGGTVSMTVGQTSMGAGIAQFSQCPISGIDGNVGSETCKVQVSGDDVTGTSDKVSSAIFMLRLNVFKDSIMNYDGTTVALSGTGYETTIDNTLVMSGTGNAAVFAQTADYVGSTYGEIIQRLLHDSTEFETGWGDKVLRAPASVGGNPKEPVTAIAVTNLAAGSRLIEQQLDTDWDTAEQFMASFSLELAASAATLTLPTISTDGTPTNINGGVTTDTSIGDMYIYHSVNSTESAATIKTFGISVPVTVAGALTYETSGVPGTTYYRHYVHVNNGLDSNVVSSSGSVTLATTFSESAIYSGAFIPDDSILSLATGTHTGGVETLLCEDTTKSFTINEFVGAEFVNLTQLGFATVTSNTATVIHFSGGLNSGDMQPNDTYNVNIAADNPDVMYVTPVITVTAEAAVLQYYIFQDSSSTYSRTVDIDLTMTGYANGDYNVTLNTDGTYSFSAVTGGGITNLILATARSMNFGLNGGFQ